MCFSPEASFSASALCGAVGITAIRRATRSTLLIALIPFLFGVHQALEGIVWLRGSTPCGIIAGTVYSAIALCFWPVYVPIALCVAEESLVRKKWIFLVAIIGMLVSADIASVFDSPLQITFARHQLRYVFPLALKYHKIVEGIYLACVVVPFFFMRNKVFNLLGLVTLVSYGISDFFFVHAKFSVWCFFAAVNSILIFFALPQKKGSRA